MHSKIDLRWPFQWFASSSLWLKFRSCGWSLGSKIISTLPSVVSTASTSSPKGGHPQPCWSSWESSTLKSHTWESIPSSFWVCLTEPLPLKLLQLSWTTKNSTWKNRLKRQATCCCWRTISHLFSLVHSFSLLENPWLQSKRSRGRKERRRRSFRTQWPRPSLRASRVVILEWTAICLKNTKKKTSRN